MTPFCNKDANPHTTGFRFFAQGYWKDHLRGRPYHISALFVVDLHKFRRRGYGDQYRIFYDSLSKDPNSLANLDQDLPNYAQHVVPIHSLPEEWLWCETWCGNGTKPNAKTIDLCNNPLTKEPKLNQAGAAANVFPCRSVATAAVACRSRCTRHTRHQLLHHRRSEKALGCACEREASIVLSARATVVTLVVGRVGANITAPMSDAPGPPFTRAHSDWGAKTLH